MENEKISPKFSCMKFFWDLGGDMGGCKTYGGGGKRTRERALPKIFGPLQKSFWSALSWIFVQEKQSTDTWGGWKTYRRRGGPKPLFGRGVIREVFHPPPFSTPPWRPLRDRLVSWTSTPSGQGCLRKNFIFLRSERWGESFGVRTSARISARTSVRHPAQKTLCLGCFPFLHRVAARAAIYRSLGALRSRNRKVVSKTAFWGSGEMSRKYPFLGVFFETFLQTPKKTLFETFLRFWARRAPRLLWMAARVASIERKHKIWVRHIPFSSFVSLTKLTSGAPQLCNAKNTGPDLTHPHIKEGGI